MFLDVFLLNCKFVVLVFLENFWLWFFRIFFFGLVAFVSFSVWWLVVVVLGQSLELLAQGFAPPSFGHLYFLHRIAIATIADDFPCA